MTWATRDVWLPSLFCAALSGICLVTYSVTAGSVAWVPAFLCFPPMAFLFSAFAHRTTRQRVTDLEAKLRQVESR